jgi:dihydrofolate reductase
VGEQLAPERLGAATRCWRRRCWRPGLIDELRLSVHPVLAGAGLPQFSNGHKTPLTLISAETFASGVVVLSYRTAGPRHE